MGRGDVEKWNRNGGMSAKLWPRPVLQAAGLTLELFSRRRGSRIGCWTLLRFLAVFFGVRKILYLWPGKQWRGGKREEEKKPRS